MKRILLSVLLIIFSNIVYSQGDIYTNGSYNGKAWNKMFINSKLNYLTSFLERRKYTDRPEVIIEDNNCKKILNDISEGKIKIQSSLKDMVGYINTFYSEEKNTKIPVVNAYCTIVTNIFDYNIPFKKESIDSLRILYPLPKH